MATLATLDQAVFLYLNADLTTAAWKLDIAAVTAQYPIYVIALMLVGLWCLPLGPSHCAGMDSPLTS